MSRLWLPLIAATHFLTGCCFHDDVMFPDLRKVQKSVLILSEPAGARIEVDDNYVGDTPITITVPAYACNGYFTKHTTITALPIRDGQYVQNKFFSGNDEFPHIGNPVPDRIFFDMRLGRSGPPPTQVDVDVHHY